MLNLLLIDDEPGIRHAFRKAFHPPDYDTATASTAAEGLECFETARPDVVVLDVHLPDADGLAALARLKQVDARVPVIMVTGHGTAELAIEAMKSGAFDYLLKPLQYDQLKGVVDRACASSRLMNVPAVVVGSGLVPDRADALVGRCPAMQEVYKAIGRVTDSDTTVLILGESGTGKELVARAIYQHSPRADRPFLAINCAAIPDALIESELFGHEKGAFTGAERKRIGKFEQNTGGTLFFDEVGELPMLAQVKLLRVLQERAFERVGGTETVHADVRLIAATNADLEGMIASGRFRQDLYFRLNVFSIVMPPLRERGGDIDLLADYYLRRFAAEFRKPVPILPDETRAALRAAHWPGNVRELQSVLKQGFLQMAGPALLPEFLSFTARPKPEPRPPAPEPQPRGILGWDQFINERLDAGSKDLYADCLAAMERHLLQRVLQKTAGNQLRAAELLGISRGSLRHKLRSHGLAVERLVSAEDDEEKAASDTSAPR
jgi:two-component system nitrogen regulation response regulator GlnG